MSTGQIYIRTSVPRYHVDMARFVCGSTFETNQERLIHLESFKHIDLYNTGSPQEREEVHRLSV